ncbi:hypothetical protein LXA43DRAFT_125796 [Ganoderma leucocontextum]|nr:hypothetical protein LXA43DRAFT_125796 [Ganoderma leucocontextum]
MAHSPPSEVVASLHDCDREGTNQWHGAFSAAAPQNKQDQTAECGCLGLPADCHCHCQRPGPSRGWPRSATNNSPSCTSVHPSNTSSSLFACNCPDHARNEDIGWETLSTHPGSDRSIWQPSSPFPWAAHPGLGLLPDCLCSQLLPRTGLPSVFPASWPVFLPGAHVFPSQGRDARRCNGIWNIAAIVPVPVSSKCDVTGNDRRQAVRKIISWPRFRSAVLLTDSEPSSSPISAHRCQALPIQPCGRKAAPPG